MMKKKTVTEAATDTERAASTTVNIIAMEKGTATTEETDTEDAMGKAAGADDVKTPAENVKIRVYRLTDA